MTMTGGETERGGVSKRVRVTALFFPSLVQCSLLRRYHHLEQLITPFSWTLLSGAIRHPQINGHQANLIAAAVTAILSPILNCCK